MDESNQQPKTHSISVTSFVFMLAVAILGDIISFGLGFITIDGGVINSVFAFFMNMSIWLWSAFNGMGWKGAVTGSVSMVVEIFPWIGALPTFTAAVIVIFSMSRIKEKIPLPDSVKKLAKKI